MEEQKCRINGLLCSTEWDLDLDMSNLDIDSYPESLKCESNNLIFAHTNQYSHFLLFFSQLGCQFLAHKAYITL